MAYSKPPIAHKVVYPLYSYGAKPITCRAKKKRVTRTARSSTTPASYKPTTEATNHARTAVYSDKLTTGTQLQSFTT